MASSRKRKIGKALFVFKQNDETMDASVISIMDRMKTELIRRGIDVTYDEYDMNCNTAIMFVTKAFLDDRYDDITDIRNRFSTLHCSMIICDDKDKKFVDFIKYCVFESVKYGEKEDRAREIDGYEVTVDDVNDSIGTLVVYSQPKYRIIQPGVSPASDEDIQKFADEFADEAVKMFNPSEMDYATIDPALESDLAEIYQNLLHGSSSESESDDDLLFAVFSGCQCCCFDTTISKLIRNLHFLTPFEFKGGFAILRKEYQNTCNDPFTLQSAFIRAKYGRDDDVPGYIRYHLKYAFERKFLVLIEDFDFSDNGLALLMLSNLTRLIGKRSVVIITTSSSTQLFDRQMAFMKLVQGSTCNNDTDSMVKCYTVMKSKLLPTNETEDVQMSLSYHDTLEKKYTESNDLAQFQTPAKKLKTTLI